MRVFTEKTRPAFFGLAALALLSTAQAQPQVEIVFESMFGQHGFFQNGSPPNGFSSPSGVSFIDNIALCEALQHP